MLGPELGDSEGTPEGKVLCILDGKWEGSRLGIPVATLLGDKLGKRLGC